MTKTNYEVSGTRSSHLGTPENFIEIIIASNAREAYLTINQDNSFDRIRVIAIKIECPTCAGFHLIIPTEYYLS